MNEYVGRPLGFGVGPAVATNENPFVGKTVGGDVANKWVGRPLDLIVDLKVGILVGLELGILV